MRLDDLRAERKRQSGRVWLGLRFWRALRLDELCREVTPWGGEEVASNDMAAVRVLARLREPPGESHIAESWYRTTAPDRPAG